MINRYISPLLESDYSISRLTRVDQRLIPNLSYLQGQVYPPMPMAIK
jgi:hypothetical protein